jgi:hypothetical protein
MKKLSIICPIYNENKTIELFYSRVKPIIDNLKTKKIEPYLIFINNGSSDDSFNIIKSIIKKTKNVSIITLSRNFGYQNSLFFSLQKIVSDLYIFIDVDCEDPPELILNFINELNSDVDIVYGERIDREESFILKKFRNLFYKITKFLADEEIILYMAEFCLFTKEVRDAIINENNSFPFIRSSIGRIGFNRKKITYKRSKRIAGKTNYNLFNMFIFAIAGILSSTTIFLRIPIYLFPFLTLFFLVSIYYNLYLGNSFYLEIFFNVAILFISYSVSFICIYLARVYKNILQRPNAYIKKEKTIINKNIIYD